MSNPEIAERLHQAVTDTANSFHLSAITAGGVAVSVPATYQILEPGFRPFRAGKASAVELQGEIDAVVGEAESRSVDLGIESQESLRKLCLQLGLGIDCSNFAYRAMTAAHNSLELPSYTTLVYRNAREIERLYREKASWSARDHDGGERELTVVEKEHLKVSTSLDVAWICDVFGKDPEFVIGSKHLAEPETSRVVELDDLQPGDMLVFEKAGTGNVSHVGVVESIEGTRFGRTFVNFWHSWHSRDFESGLRRDTMTDVDGTRAWSHEGLSDPSRYSNHYFVRANEIAKLAEE